MGKGKRAARKLRELYRKVSDLDSRGPLACPPCQASEHFFCDNPDLEDSVCCCIGIGDTAEFSDVGEKTRGGQVKSAFDITDVQSTGRKRAALMYPISEGMICEWKELKTAGGGVIPVVGCFGNPATDIHHGPDKNTLNNTEINIHRICAFCHNWWHGRNDKFYGSRPVGTEPFIPLDPHEWCQHDKETKATMEEIVLAQMGRKQPKKVDV